VQGDDGTEALFQQRGVRVEADGIQVAFAHAEDAARAEGAEHFPYRADVVAEVADGLMGVNHIEAFISEGQIMYVGRLKAHIRYVFVFGGLACQVEHGF
jgi:hypothetical protein